MAETERISNRKQGIQELHIENNLIEEVTEYN